MLSKFKEGKNGRGGGLSQANDKNIAGGCKGKYEEFVQEYFMSLLLCNGVSLRLCPQLEWLNKLLLFDRRYWL